MSDEVLPQMVEAVVNGAEEEVVALCHKGLEAGTAAEELLRDGLLAGMRRVGELYDSREVFLPEMLLASEAMKAGVDVIKASLRPQEEAEAGEVVVLGVVEGDVHEIGKNLVGMMLEASGYRVIDVGTDVSAYRFVSEVKSSGARMLALSTMMTTTLPNMRATVEMARGIEPPVSIIVGGAPLSLSLAMDMGADGYEENAARVASLVRTLLSR